MQTVIDASNSKAVAVEQREESKRTRKTVTKYSDDSFIVSDASKKTTVAHKTKVIDYIYIQDDPILESVQSPIKNKLNEVISIIDNKVTDKSVPRKTLYNVPCDNGLHTIFYTFQPTAELNKTLKQQVSNAIARCIDHEAKESSSKRIAHEERESGMQETMEQHTKADTNRAKRRINNITS